MRKIFALILIICTGSLLAQEVDFNPRMQVGFKSVVRLRYPQLFELLEKERREHPNNVVPDYLEMAALSLQGFFAENEQWFSEHEERFDQLMERVQALPDEEPYKRVFLAEMHLARSGMHGKFKHNVKAAWGFYQAYNLLEQNLEEHPDFMPTLIPFGLLQTAVGSLPDEYKSVASLFGFKGNIEEGLKMMRRAYYFSLADPDLKVHQEYFGFMFAYTNFELETEEQASLYTLGLSVKESVFFSYLEAQQNLRSGDARGALETLESAPQGEGYLQIPFFEYYQGKVALMVEPDKALAPLEGFIESNRDGEYILSAKRYLAWYYLLKSSPTRAYYIQQDILAAEHLPTGSDKQAKREAERGFNLYLIKARLDFDAGRYSSIVESLDPMIIASCCEADWERQEFHYRRARALQELGLRDQAITAFLEVLKYPEVSSFSLANSTLQLALIFEEKGNWQRSRLYFNQVLNLKDYPFQEGVQQKAKAGLERLP